MSSNEYKYGFLHIIFSDGSFRNRMMNNRIHSMESSTGVPLPHALKHNGLKRDKIKEIASILTAPAYVEASQFMGRYGLKTSYSYIYFENPEDAMAFKLLYEGDDQSS